MKFPSVSLILGVCLLCCSLATKAQLTVDNSGNYSNPNFLVQDVLVGNGINASNITFSGDAAQQIGYFDGSNTNLGINSGVIIATGSIHMATGPNNATDATLPPLGIQNTTDQDLEALAAGGTLFDAAVLEFDFIPVGNEVVLRYVFASEEYDENVCTDIADVFGVFVSGPGIAGPYSNGGDNYALIPSTSTAVSINTVNNGSIGANGGAGGCGGAGDPGLNNSQYFVSNTGDSLQYDGHTVVLEARITVECGESYHIRLGVGDIDNQAGLWDSAIFLEASSFHSSGTAFFNNPVMGDTAVVEGCSPGYIFLTRQDSVGDEVYYLTITGAATNGVDYDMIADSVVIQDGDPSTFIEINAIADGIADPGEHVIIAITVITECGDTVDKVWDFVLIDEYIIDLDVTGGDEICAGESVTIDAAVTGGFPGYNYSWTTGQTNANFTLTPTVTTIYSLWLYDSGGCTATDADTVVVNPLPIANAGPDTALCMGRPHTLGLWIDAYAGGTYTWAPPYDLADPSAAYAVMTPTMDRTYNLTVVTAAGCTATDQITVTALPVPTADAGPDQEITYQQEVATLIGQGTGANAMWTPDFNLGCPPCFETAAWPTETTEYTLTVTHQNGCVTRDWVTVEVIVPELVFLPEAFSPNGDGSNDILYVRGYTIAEVELQVFDRWGNPVFKTNDINIGWDGTHNGQPAVGGVYMYTLTARLINGVETKMQGDIALIR